MKFAAPGLILSLAIPIAAFSDEVPTAPFRNEHVEVKKHLNHLDVMVGQLPTASRNEQRKIMNTVVEFLDDHIRKHAEWEEAKLYPAVDKRTHAGPPPFTASMRYEHRIIGRSIDQLKTLSASANPDVTNFARSTDRLLGLINAHFEEEEEVLLPILDRSMTKADFEAELGLKAGHERHQKH